MIVDKFLYFQSINKLIKFKINFNHLASARELAKKGAKISIFDLDEKKG
jgi:hypothetical protein